MEQFGVISIVFLYIEKYMCKFVRQLRCFYFFFKELGVHYGISFLEICVMLPLNLAKRSLLKEGCVIVLLAFQNHLCIAFVLLLPNNNAYVVSVLDSKTAPICISWTRFVSGRTLYTPWFISAAMLFLEKHIYVVFPHYNSRCH